MGPSALSLNSPAQESKVDPSATLTGNLLENLLKPETRRVKTQPIDLETPEPV